MNKLIASIILLSVSYNAFSGCVREPRSQVWEGNTIQITIPEQPNITRVLFPEKDLKGLQVSTTDGILYGRPNESRIPNQLTLSANTNDYNGLIMVDGESGETYTIQVNTDNNDCDSQVKIVSREDLGASKSYNSSKGNISSKKPLPWYMYNGIIPRGFRKMEFSGSLEDRFVMEIGSVKFYAESQLISRNVIGTTFKLVNEGREGFLVELPPIDFSDPDIREVFGDVKMISMAPFDFLLGPAPETVSDLYTGPKSYGYFFVVSEK